jgi:hypothetical protein
MTSAVAAQSCLSCSQIPVQALILMKKLFFCTPELSESIILNYGIMYLRDYTDWGSDAVAHIYNPSYVGGKK